MRNLEQFINDSDNLSHEEFVNGIKSGRLIIHFDSSALIGWDIINADEAKKLKGFVTFTFISPYLFTILAALAYKNVWFLLGLPLAFAAGGIAFNASLIQLLIVPVLSTIYWLKYGFALSDYLTFFSVLYILTQVLKVIYDRYAYSVFLRAMLESQQSYFLAADRIKLYRTNRVD